MASKQKFTTPLGTANFPHLNRLDTAFGQDNAKFKTEVVMSAKDGAALIKQIEDYGDNEHGKNKWIRPWMDVLDDAGEKTGNVKFKASTKFLPEFFDATGQVVVPEKVPSIGGGSTIRISGMISASNISNTRRVSMLLNRVQLGDIKSSFGEDFGAIEGSFSVDDANGYNAPGASFGSGENIVAQDDTDQEKYDF